jgi:7-carboxy-7-deazaguanine synthase
MTPRAAKQAPTGALVELFSGIQGEGIHVGRRQIFLRLAQCNLSCAYCDQPEARNIPPFWLREQTPGARDFIATPNPVTPEQAVAAVLALHKQPGLTHSISITGGEPLLQADFLKAALPPLRKAGLDIMLETNGVLPDALRALRGCVDIVSMDIKLKSTTGRPMPLKSHTMFLAAMAKQHLSGYAKAVVSSATTMREIATAARLVSDSKCGLPLVLQPVTLIGRGKPRPPSPEALLALQDKAAQWVDDVRVIPQVHKFMGQR